MSTPKTTALARPPFAVDDDNTEYAKHSQQPRRPREERNKVSESTYDAYDTYLDPSDSNDVDHNRLNPKSTHRPTPSADDGYGAIGGGLLAAGSDIESSDDEDDPRALPRLKTTPDQGKSKNQALFEAAVSGSDQAQNPFASPISPAGSSPIAPPAYEAAEEKGSVSPFDDKSAMRLANPTNPPGGRTSPNLQVGYGGRGPSPSITPPPAAPVQVNIPVGAPQPKRPIPAAQGGPQGGPIRGPPLTVAVPPPAAFPQPNGFGYPGPMPTGSAYGSPGFHMTPTPIPEHTGTPIQPAFIKPIKPAFIKFQDSVNEKSSPALSQESSMPIMRGDKEDYLPLRSGPRTPRVGQKREGDDFWRRFSMVMKQEKAKPPVDRKSDWLKSKMGSDRAMSRWVWCVGIFALICIIGGSVAGWYFTRSNPSHSIPVTIGGGAGETAGPTATTPVETPTTPTHKPSATTSKASTAKRNKRETVSGHRRSQQRRQHGVRVPRNAEDASSQ